MNTPNLMKQRMAKIAETQKQIRDGAQALTRSTGSIQRRPRRHTKWEQKHTK